VIRFTTISLLLVSLLSANRGLLAQSTEHVTAVKTAFRAAYSITQSTNACPNAKDDIFGWPKERLHYCEYRQLDQRLGHARKAVVWLLDVRPELLAQWIEKACTKILPSNERCFDIVLKFGRDNSGYMFAVTGNVIEDMEVQGVFKNYFFRNGMTVSVRRGVNGGVEELNTDAQTTLAMTADENILTIPSGRARFWSTTPAEFASRFPNGGAPTTLSTKEQRTEWLALVRRETLNALDSSSNRLLEAWLCSNARLLGATAECLPP
jgi:hypothetical protein